MRGSAKNVKGLTRVEFLHQTNMIAVLLLVFIVVVLITSSKILEKVGEDEIERAYTTGRIIDDAQGTVSLSITPNTTAATTAAAASVTTDGEVLTSGGKLGFYPGKFDLDMFHGGIVERELKIRNNANYDLEMSFGTSLKDYVVVEPSEIPIGEGESGMVIVRFDGKDLGVITGYLSATGGGLKGYVPIVLNVGSARATGLLKVSIPNEFKQVQSGDDILVSIDLAGFNGDVIEIVYIIKDSENNELIKTTQTMTIGESTTFDKTLTMPNVRDGLYVVGVEVRYAGMTLVDSEVLTVGHYEPFVEKPAVVGGFGLNPITFKIILLLVMIMIIILFATYSREIGKMERRL